MDSVQAAGSIAYTRASSIFPRINAEEMGNKAPTILRVWIYFNMINTALLLILLGTFIFSKKVRKHPVLINLSIAWIFSGVFSLLLFLGGQEKGPKPDQMLCTIQASLLNGITPMWSVAVLMLFYYLNLSTRGDHNIPDIGRTKTILMLSAPYIAQCSFSSATFILACKDPHHVTRYRRFFYCSFENLGLFFTMSVFTAVICLAIMILEIKLAVTLYRNWQVLRRIGYSSGVDTQLFVRVLVFGVYIAFGIAATFIFIFDCKSYAPDFYAATIGTVVFLVFGTQMDVLRVWFRMEKKQVPRSRAGLCHLCQHERTQTSWDDEKGRDLIQRPESVMILA